MLKRFTTALLPPEGTMFSSRLRHYDLVICRAQFMQEEEPAWQLLKVWPPMPPPRGGLSRRQLSLLRQRHAPAMASAGLREVTTRLPLPATRQRQNTTTDEGQVLKNPTSSRNQAAASQQEIFKQRLPAAEVIVAKNQCCQSNAARAFKKL